MHSIVHHCAYPILFAILSMRPTISATNTSNSIDINATIVVPPWIHHDGLRPLENMVEFAKVIPAGVRLCVILDGGQWRLVGSAGDSTEENEIGDIRKRYSDYIFHEQDPRRYENDDICRGTKQEGAVDVSVRMLYLASSHSEWPTDAIREAEEEFRSNNADVVLIFSNHSAADSTIKATAFVISTNMTVTTISHANYTGTPHWLDIVASRLNNEMLLAIQEIASTKRMSSTNPSPATTVSSTGSEKESPGTASSVKPKSKPKKNVHRALGLALIVFGVILDVSAAAFLAIRYLGPRPKPVAAPNVIKESSMKEQSDVVHTGASYERVSLQHDENS